jgi:uncharacterized SAM-binding protein YcdF (DUF218 family)
LIEPILNVLKRISLRLPRVRLPRWRTTVRFVLIFGLIWLVVGISLATAVHFYGQVDQATDSDVIIVLGAGLRRDSAPGPALTRRSAHAATLYAQGIAPRIICTGGLTGGRQRSEADACRELLVSAGVPADVIFLEERSRSTEENALYTHQLMNENDWQTAVIVSDGFHMLRARWIFELEGIRAVTSPAPTRPRLSAYIPSVMREVAALHWQLIQEVFNLPVTAVPLL